MKSCVPRKYVRSTDWVLMPTKKEMLAIALGAVCALISPGFAQLEDQNDPPSGWLPHTIDLATRYRDTLPSPESHNDPVLIRSRGQLLDDFLEFIRTDPPRQDMGLARQRAMFLASELGRPILARAIARDELRSVIDASVLAEVPSRSVPGEILLRSWIVRYGMDVLGDKWKKAAEDGGQVGIPRAFSPDDPDMQTVHRDIHDFADSWRRARPLDITAISPFEIHRTRTKASSFLRSAGFYDEAAELFHDAAEFARRVLDDDPDLKLGWNAGYCKTLEALTLLEDGRVQEANRAIGELRSFSMLSLGGEPAGAYVQLLLTVKSSIFPEGSNERCDIALRWLDGTPADDWTFRDVDLVGWLATYINANEPSRNPERARRVLDLIDRALDTRAALDESNRRNTFAAKQEHEKNTAPTGYAAEPATGELYIKRFILARQLGDAELAMASAEIVLTRYHNAPGMPIVAGWYKRQMQKETSP